MLFKRYLVRLTLAAAIAGGGIIPLMAWAITHPDSTRPNSCGCSKNTGLSGLPSTTPVINLLIPQGVILTCPRHGSDMTTRDEWCKRVVNSDCDGWSGSKSDYLRARNKCWWDNGNNTFYVTCGAWQPWGCCYEQDATPEPPCARNRQQIYCVPDSPTYCP